MAACAGAGAHGHQRRLFSLHRAFLLLLALPPLVPPPASTVVAQAVNVSETDRQALLSFKSGVSDDPHGVLRSWLGGSSDFCTWHGVACGGAPPPRVVSLNLSSALLTGALHPSLANLSSLSVLDLADNRLSGKIPANLFSSSSHLAAVDLGNNLLSGPITDFHNMSLSALNFLDLGYNSLSGMIPSSLGNVSSLSYILLTNNNLVGSIPESFGDLENLRELRLGYNKLSGHVPEELCNMSSLNLVDLVLNDLAGKIPSCIGNTLPNLEALFMSYNNLEGFIPPSLANASKLQIIDLGHNSLAGPVPSLGSLSYLVSLILERNILEAQGWGFLGSLTNCARLRTLALGANALKGSVPASIGNFSTSLQGIDLGSNQIAGAIPVEIGNLRNLQMLAMDRNLLSGVIPSVIWNLYKLVVLNLSGNKFSGEILPLVGNLSSLNRLYLDNNDLSRTIPASLGACNQLAMLNLSFNNLEGSIPMTLMNTSLSLGLDLSNNRLTGSIPDQIGVLIHLGSLDISFNRLSGEVPFLLGRCVELNFLRLKHNMLTGIIPLSLGTLSSIILIDLSQNNLAGQIPVFFVNMILLQKLDLSSNHFVGPIPTGGIFQNNSAAVLDGNPGLYAVAAPTLFPIGSTPAGRSKNTHIPVMVIPPVAVILFVVICFVVTRRRTRRRVHATPCYKETMKKVSYGDIVKATGWFSPVNKISSSGTSSVYIGRFQYDTDLVAIKSFHLEQAGASNSFLTECKVVRNTRHRNIVKAITMCSTVDLDNNEFKAIVYEFMANGSLDMWMHPKLRQNSHKRVLSLGQRIRIAMNVVSALDYMHNQLTPPLIHCDLKPGNVLLDYDMTARVGDFGSAMFLASSLGGLQALVGVGGTVGYVAPEYAMGCKVSAGCDVYGFGVLLLEMLTRKRPTDAMFSDGLTLHKLVSSAFPDRLREVLDPYMFHDERHSCAMMSYVAPLVEVGLLCSMDSPKDRPGMRKVGAKISSIEEAFFKGDLHLT